jgi:glycosyltransferase involved in cell wall biosynthesis
MKSSDAPDGLKLLLIAPTCDGEDVGEAWVAFQWVRRLAERHDVTLLTYHKRGRTPASRQLSGLRVIEWTEPPGLGRAERLNSMLKPGYVPFYLRARRWTRAALRAGERFEVAHQLVPVAMRYPCPVAGLGIPYLVGPVGGSLDNPSGFEAESDTAPWYVGLRGLDRARLRWDPVLRRSYEGAACVLGIAPYVRSSLDGLKLQRFEVLSETGLERLPECVDRTNRTGPVRLLYVGRLVRPKGARDAIRAMAELRDQPVVLDVVGDGFDRSACEDLVAELGLGERVRFLGRLDRDLVDDLYRAADIFVFPSYREPGGNVVFEAMGFGLPVVTSDRGGPGSAVDESSGFRVTPVEPRQYAQDLAVAVGRLVNEPSLRAALGLGARRRVAETALWDRKVDQVDAWYAELRRTL